MGKKDIFYTKFYFKYYCNKNKSFFNKINSLDNGNYIFDVSHSSLERYEIINSYLIDNNLLNKNLKILDFGCYIGFYIRFLQDIGINNTYGIDLSYKSIEFGKKIGIKNLMVGDITNLKKQINKNSTINFISCIHVFEYIYILKNGDEFVYNTLKEGYRLLEKGGKVLFNIGEGYQKFDRELNKYIHIDGKVNLSRKKIIELGFGKFKFLGSGYYILVK